MFDMKPLRAAITAVFACASLASLACGQVSGLSDDYTFDLVEAGAASSDAGDSGAADAAAALDSGAPVDAGSAQCKAAASRDLANEGVGTVACRTCAADKCCGLIEACLASSGGPGCRNTLKCALACSSENARTACLAKCDGVQGAAFADVRACLQQGCSAACF
jgi:hypothetical protein